MKNITLHASAVRAMQKSLEPAGTFRQALRYIFLDVEARTAVATNGTILTESAFIGSSEFTDYTPMSGYLVRLDKLIPETWGTVTLDLETMRAHGDNPSKHSCGFQFPDDGTTPKQFPPWQRVSTHQPDHGTAFVHAAPNSAANSIGMDLSIIAPVVGKHPVRFDWAAGGAHIRVTPLDHVGFLVTFMPCRLS